MLESVRIFNPGPLSDVVSREGENEQRCQFFEVREISGCSRHRTGSAGRCSNGYFRVGIALNAQQVARRGIIIALFDLEMALVNDRKAIALIPEGDSAERSNLNDDLFCLEKSLEDIGSIARGL